MTLTYTKINVNQGCEPGSLTHQKRVSAQRHRPISIFKCLFKIDVLEKKHTHTCQTRKCTSTTCTHRFGHTVTGKPPSVKDSPCAMKHRMSRCDILSNYTRHSHDTNYVYLVRKHMRIRASASMVIVIVEVHTKAQTWSSSTCVCALSNVI